MPYKNKSDANANQRQRRARDPEKTKAYYRKRVRNYRLMREALEFYASRKNLEIDSFDSSINFDYRHPEWRIGPPYLKSAEFGQRARKTLNEIK